MDCFDAIVAGSGPGGAFAAYGLRGKRVLLLDVGYDAAASPRLSGNVYDLRRTRDDLFPELIGENFESLHNLHDRPISLKLKSPLLSFVVRDWRSLTPIVSQTFEGVISLAKGGLANAWGAGVYRFTNRDLSGFPISNDDLQSCYDELVRHIGVSGANDDLEPYFGRDEALLPPLELSPLFSDLLARYERARDEFARAGAFVGRARLAVLTQPLNGRAAYEYENLEFFQPHIPAIYTPSYTIDQLRSEGAITYLSGRLVERFQERAGCVEVHTRNIETNEMEVWRGRKLCLAAGTLNTARIVLQSAGDYATRLPVLDNPMACIPIFSLRRIGAGLSLNDSSLAQLNCVIEDRDSGEPVQGTLYGSTGPLRSDVLFTLPLSFRSNLTLLRHVAPAGGLLMLFYPGVESPRSYLRLSPSGELEVEFAECSGNPEIEGRIIRLLRRIGYLTHPALVQRPGMGQALHYAGSLPMRDKPGPYQTHADGRLAGTAHVHIVDGACFSRLPSKNLTFTIMANAMRIGRLLARELS